MIRLLTGLLLAAVLTALPAPSYAQTRRALVIGVDDYRNVSKLQKAVGDALAMKGALEKLGFEVDLLANPDRSAFNAGVSAFTQKLKSGDVALVHYSGHGVALDGENYLLPIDAPRPDRVDKEGLKLESFALMPLIERIRATGSNVQIAIVDACRDNPYAQSGTRSIGRSGGLVEPGRRPAKGQGGFFIMFSAGFGQTAADRLNDSDREPTSVYTRTLLTKIGVEGKPITDLAREVREDVEALASTVNHEQRPAYYDELSGPMFFFAPPRGGVVAAVPQQIVSRPAEPAAQPLQQQQPISAQQLIPVTTQPSFDCSRARGRDELAICGDVELSALDRMLSQVYYALADSLSGDGRMALRVAQGQWLSQRQLCDANVPCIGQAYRSRIAQLQGSNQQAGNRQAGLAPVPARTTTPPQPSFDCRKARKPDEQAVCSDAALAAKDVRLSEVFGQYRAQLSPDAFKQLLKNQAAWMAQRGQCGSDIACVGRAYDERIRQIETFISRR
jgi:uncharacterized protein